MKRFLLSVVSAVCVACIFSSCTVGEQGENNGVTVNTQQNSESYIFEEDYQYYISNDAVMAKAPGGYYYFDGSLLMFFDAESKKAYPVCDKANCNHNSDKCSAYFSMVSYRTTELYYYNNFLYTHYCETKNDIRTHYVCRVSLNGKERTKVRELFKSSSSYSAKFFLHRGYVYLIRETASAETGRPVIGIYRARLDEPKEEPVEIFSILGENCVLSNVTVYGNHLYFKISQATGSTDGGYEFDVYDYNFVTENCEKIGVPGLYYDYALAGRDMFYYDTTREEYVIYNLDEENIVAECALNIVGYVMFDGENFYVDTLQSENLGLTEKREIYVIDKKGKIIKSFEADSDYELLYGGEDLMFAIIYLDGGEAEMAYYDKSQNNTSSSDWVEFY